MPKMIHPLAGTLALLTILIFWFSTVLSELFATQPTITMIKALIPWGFLVLVPALMLTSLSGRRVSKGRGTPLIAKKQKRIPFIAANGIFVLIPSAIYLSIKAQAGAFDTAFYTIQSLELVFGAINIILLSLNMRDGLYLSGKLRRSKEKCSASSVKPNAGPLTWSKTDFS